MTPERAQRGVIVIGGVTVAAVAYADIKGGALSAGSDWSQPIDVMLWTALAAMVAEVEPDIGIGIAALLLLNVIFPAAPKRSPLAELFSPAKAEAAPPGAPGAPAPPGTAGGSGGPGFGGGGATPNNPGGAFGGNPAIPT